MSLYTRTEINIERKDTHMQKAQKIIVLSSSVTTVAIIARTRDPSTENHVKEKHKMGKIFRLTRLG